MIIIVTFSVSILQNTSLKVTSMLVTSSPGIQQRALEYRVMPEICMRVCFHEIFITPLGLHCFAWHYLPEGYRSVGLGGCHCISRMMRERYREKQTDTEFRGHGSKLCVIIWHICPVQCTTSPTSLLMCMRQDWRSERRRRQLSVKKQIRKWQKNDSTRRDRKTAVAED